MDLQHINVRAQALHARVHGIENVLARQPNLIHHVAVIRRYRRDGRLRAVRRDAEVAFREDHDAVARDVEFLERLADDFLRSPVRVRVCLLSR